MTAPTPKRKASESVVRVTDRTYEAMLQGALFERWPGDVPPDPGRRVYVFDRNLEFTQHVVVAADGMRVQVGPAIPFRGASRTQREAPDA